ncbi:right-handed parallel beta-helix repeat-containing protein [Microvirga terrestris]|uniref:Right-handed parallel beta-helix repeat-containing protein n=1 Tax=Microvirga terrestris TaxID=2791024 RepID=A0ABS0HVM8_9HYPH|nr:right-handed parallel beta-helix repeat-containing protein [Microvirga terrestris]MBF9197527.1 right-handed parallel beta-helix repeat-containing protein [Microvirga terrestris]
MATNIIWVAKTGRSGALGTESSPLASIQEAINKATPGTTIMVKSGVYTENLKFSKGGTASAPIVLVSADGPSKAEIKPASGTADTIRVQAPANYITVDGFKVYGPSSKDSVHITSSDNMTKISTGITIQNMEILATRGDGIKVSQGDHIKILNNKVSGSTSEQGIDLVGATHSVISGNDVSGIATMAGIQVKGGSYDIEISYNTVHDTGKWGFLVGGVTSPSSLLPGTTDYEVKDVRMFGNEVDGSAAQAVRVMGGTNVKISGNWFHNVASSRFIDVLAAADQHAAWASKNVTFENNSFDRASWLTVESGNPQPTLTGNITSGQTPAGWVDSGGAVNTAPTPAPTPTVPAPTAPSTPLPTKLPSAYDDKASTMVSTAVKIDVLANDDAIAWVNAKITNPLNGTLKSGGNDTIVYTPKTGFTGVDTFKYTLTDADGHQSTATVTVEVGGTTTTQKLMADYFLL